MSTPQWIKDVLRGGIPELIDLGDQAPNANENQDGMYTRPEQRPPVNTGGYETANPPGNFLMAVNQNQILMFTAVIVGALALVQFGKKL